MPGGDWFQVWLSLPRWNAYLSACDNDPDLVLDLYEWNLGLATAKIHDIAHIEVAVRNIYDQTITARWQGAERWLFDAASPVTAPLVRSRRGKNVDLNAINRTNAES